MARLGDICTIQSGGTPSRGNKEYWANGTIPWVKISDFSGKHLNCTSEKITQEGLDNSSAKVFSKGTILYTIFATLGETAILDIDATTNQAIAGLKLNDDSVSTDYLYYYLLSKKDYVNEIGRGVAQNNINLKILREMEISVPSTEEQRHVSETLNKVYDLISLRKQQLAKLDELVKARFVELFESSELSDETTIEAVTKQVKVGFVGTCEKYYTDEAGVPMLRTGNITEKGIDLKDLKYVTREFHEKNKKSQIHTGDLLIARHGSNGQANVYSGPEAQCLNAVVIVPNQSIASSIFLAGLINAPMVKEQIERTLVGSTQRVVNTKSIANLKVRVPSTTVQKQYEEFVKQTDKSKLTIQQSLEQLETLKKALMQKYFE